ncbi:hypothetical protein LRP30_33145 [Bradyrhizobium sp. C-145]|uniref:hypothetical protein n=1 Tax=Bradyrhizobium sp. C-145 TaxID=574727 RepID=UPI00201B811E|nr:hypothetical protein [Bradyrhizobium sp. C-145]UQR61633.1 hypothetical protein LRP30_33145 [Bradyrhizobium sp. C-145]
MRLIWRYLFKLRLTSGQRSVTENPVKSNSRESDMSASMNSASSSGDRSLDRDESRFRFFSPNGKAVIRIDYERFLTVKTSFERAQEAAGN